jgi:hypothetical protein
MLRALKTVGWILWTSAIVCIVKVGLVHFGWTGTPREARPYEIAALAFIWAQMALLLIRNHWKSNGNTLSIRSSDVR